VEYNLKYVPTERQALAHANPKYELLYGGAVGGGKSVFLVMEAFALCLQYPGNRGFLGRKVGKHFVETTLKVWQEYIPSDLYRINWQKGYITVFCPNGQTSEIVFGGFNKQEDIDRFTSAEYGFVGIDQAEEITENDFLAIMQRIRRKLPNGKQPRYRALFTANPRACYIRNRFITNPGEKQAFIQALPSDNPHLPKEYYDNLKDLLRNRPEMYEAMINGSWDLLEGAEIIIKMAWCEKIRNKKVEGQPYEKVIVQVDTARFGDDECVIYGFENENVVKQDIFGMARVTETGARAVKMAREMGANTIGIETDGIGGGVADVCLDILGKNSGITVIEQVANSRADKSDRYGNLRAEAWFEAADTMGDSRASLPNDNQLITDLTSVQYHVSRGRIFAEAKEDLKARIGRSPDRGDAYVFGLYTVKRAKPLSVGIPKSSTSKWVRDRERELEGAGNSYSAMEE